MLYNDENAILIKQLFTKYYLNQNRLVIQITEYSNLNNLKYAINKYKNISDLVINSKSVNFDIFNYINTLNYNVSLNLYNLTAVNYNNLKINYYLNLDQLDDLKDFINNRDCINYNFIIKLTYKDIDQFESKLIDLIKLSQIVNIILEDNIELDYTFDKFKSIYNIELNFLKNILQNDGVPLKVGYKLKNYLTDIKPALFQNIKLINNLDLKTLIFLDLDTLIFNFGTLFYSTPLFYFDFTPINTELLNYILTAKYPIDFPECNLCKYSYLCSEYSIKLNINSTKDLLFNNCIQLKRKYEYLTTQLDNVFNFKLIIED